eukprot:m.449577 g.449577  ORF g.449577 m.449577 type:complete len:753 (+) comp19841_c0_seq1:144-2402(+)
MLPTIQVSADRFEDSDVGTYSPENFVERCTLQRNPGAGAGAGADFDPSPLLGVFEATIAKLQEIKVEVAQHISDLEGDVALEETNAQIEVSRIHPMAREVQEALSELSGGMKGVSHKIAHIGNMLENKHHARKRAIRARTVMEHFEAFHSEGELLPPFSDPEPDLHKCAEIIQQLDFICAQLPAEKFGKPTVRIKKKFAEVETELLKHFEHAWTVRDLDGMREYAHALFPFESYQQCVEKFINQFIAQHSAEFAIPEHGAEFTKKTIEKITAAIEKTAVTAKTMIDDVFKYPQQIVAQFLQEIMKTVQFKFIKVVLGGEHEDYLDRLHSTYVQTKELLERLTKDLALADQSGLFQESLLRKLFDEYLGSTYISMEEDSLSKQYLELVNDIGFVAKNPRRAKDEPGGSGRQTKSKKDSKNRGHVRASSNVADSEQSGQTPMQLFNDGNLLSQDVALSMIHENQRALRRCQVLGKPTELPSLAKRIFATLLKGLGEAYVQRGLEFGTSALKAKGPIEVTIKYLDLVHNANSIVYLLQKHFWDTVLPLVRPLVNEYQDCVTHKSAVLQQMETMISDGLSQCLKTAIGHCTTALSKQRKTDFCPPEDSTSFMTETCTEACKQTTLILKQVSAAIKGSLNGKNEDAAFAELGRRFYDTIVYHFRSLTVNEMGMMLLIRDISEFEKCVQSFQNTTCNELLEHIREASSVLLVPAENVRQLCDEPRMTKVPAELVHMFARLRVDYKHANLALHFTVEKQ